MVVLVYATQTEAFWWVTTVFVARCWLWCWSLNQHGQFVHADICKVLFERHLHQTVCKRIWDESKTFCCLVHTFSVAFCKKVQYHCTIRIEELAEAMIYVCYKSCKYQIPIEVCHVDFEFTYGNRNDYCPRCNKYEVSRHRRLQYYHGIPNIKEKTKNCKILDENKLNTDTHR